ncbi:MAG: 4Fe-4S dicluster domain-containing protein [Caldisericia bacterium]|nr:4Fe-4S dicluster domain-containing protein [Caldisericia bacterium]
MKKQIEKNIKSLLHSIWKSGDMAISWTKTSIPGKRTPFFIKNKNQIDQLVFDTFCAVSLATYLTEFNRKEILPEDFKGKLHITCKPCDARSVMQLFSDMQVSEELVNLIVIQCDGIADESKLTKIMSGYVSNIEEENDRFICKGIGGTEKSVPIRDCWLDKCSDGKNCDLPYYYGYYFVGNETEYRKRISNLLHTKTDLVQDTMSPKELKKLVNKELSSCIRCNACRNVCPACFCSDRCVFEQPKVNVKYLDSEDASKNNILYHMIRFNHVAPNCTGCGECERACPMSIPLSMFYKYFNRLMWEEFEYKPGKTNSERQKLLSYHLGEDLV